MTCKPDAFEAGFEAYVAEVNEPAPTMRDLLLEQLEHLRGMSYAVRIEPPEPFDLEQWVDDGGDFDGLAFESDAQREACAYAWGYLRGAAEMADLTLGGLLDEHNLTLDATPDLVYRCACSWVGGDPDTRTVRNKIKNTCPACWSKDRRRVEVHVSTTEGRE